jgi:hypothetical protein
MASMIRGKLAEVSQQIEELHAGAKELLRLRAQVFSR